jgi:hypothetical protein
VQARTAALLLGVGGALALYVFSRTARGRALVGDAVSSAIDQLDVAASRVRGLVVSRGYRNNNPGNIEFIANPAKAWNGQTGSDGRFGVYARPEDGTRALGKELQKRERNGFRTVRDLIAGRLEVGTGRRLGGWAPDFENDTGAYVTDVAGELRIDPDVPFSVTGRLHELARAIAKHENGYVDGSYNWQWVYLA